MNTTISSSQARDTAYSMPLEASDLSNPELFSTDTVWPYLERLRHEAPVHYREGGLAGSFWSVTKYKDIMAVDTNHAVFSSESSLGGITI